MRPAASDIATAQNFALTAAHGIGILIVAPRGTPQRPTRVPEASANRAVAEADVRKGIERQGLEAVFESGQALARALREQSGVYQRLIAELGLAQNAKRGN